MESQFSSNGASRWNGVILPLSFTSIIIAWAVFIAGERYINTLDLSRWGTDLDVLERLQIDAYLAHHFLPYLLGAIAFDTGAFVFLCWAGRRGPVSIFSVILWILLILSAGWHGLNFFAYGMFLI